jgi:hypothetical protein
LSPFHSPPRVPRNRGPAPPRLCQQRRVDAPDAFSSRACLSPTLAWKRVCDQSHFTRAFKGSSGSRPLLPLQQIRSRIPRP